MMMNEGFWLPTICGYCGSFLVEGDDGLLHCALKCPNWENTMEMGLEHPVALSGWKYVKIECVENG